MKTVTIYTDGACSGNPGPGGWGAILRFRTAQKVYEKELSGGEAQKIAIARALYKNAPFLVLDEPTAALDPVSEYEVYRKFNAISGGKTALYISHRLASCRFCDEILVFLAGSIVQHGAHEALLQEKNGEYARLWHAQAQYYDDSLQKKNSVK